MSLSVGVLRSHTVVFGVDKVGVYSDSLPALGVAFWEAAGFCLNPSTLSTLRMQTGGCFSFLFVQQLWVCLRGSVQLAFKKPHTYLGLILRQD